MKQLSLVLLMAGLLSGCDANPMHEYADEDAVVEALAKNSSDCQRDLDSPYIARRAAAIRALGILAGKADPMERERLAGALVAHFGKEQSAELKSLIVEVALVDSNSRSVATATFIRIQMADGAYLPEAMHAACALPIRDAAPLVSPFLEHPRHEIRVEAARALIDMRNPDLKPMLSAFITTMNHAEWPARINGVPTTVIRQSLSERLEAITPTRRAESATRREPGATASPSRATRAEMTR